MSYSLRSTTSIAFKLTALSLALVLAGCGGGGTDTVAPEPDLGVQQPEGENSTTNASNIYISSEKNRLLTGKDTAIINIRVTDTNGGIVPNAPVNINVADAALYGLSLSGSSRQITDDKGMIAIELMQSTTDVNSQLDHESILTVTTNRQKGVTQQNFPIIVSGTRVNNVVSTQNAVDAGDNFRVTGQVLDGVGASINNADVVLYNNDVKVGVGRTDNDGNFVFDVNASNLQASGGNYLFSLEIKGSKITQRIPDILNVLSDIDSNLSFSQTSDVIVGTKQKVTLNVSNANNGDTVFISTNKGEILANANESQGSSRRALKVANDKIDFYIDSNVPGKAIIRAEYGNDSRETTLSFVSINPTKLLLQTESSIVNVGGSTSVIARVLDANDAPVKNAIVQFTTIKDASGGSISQGVARTDDSGVATVTYNAGLNPTSTNGVNIKAQVQSIRLPNGQEKTFNPIQATSSVTVQTRSTYISFAFADKVSSDDSEIYYNRRGSVSVLNSAGKPAVNQQVSINLTPESYLKGFFEIIRDMSGTSSWNRNSVVCANEDKNNNGILDSGEDFNKNNQLDPINVAAVLSESGQEVSARNKFITDDTGRVDFSIRYPKQYANWYRAKVTVNTKVDGSESQQSRVIDFPALTDDIDISIPLRPNTNSPFGTRLNCSDPN